MDLQRIKKYILASQAHEIALRVFVMNSFDGILAIMGVVIGAHLSRVSDPRVVITAGIGGSVALGISGISSAYMAESAARKMKQKKLEGAMLKSLDDTQLSRASKFATVLVAPGERDQPCSGRDDPPPALRPSPLGDGAGSLLRLPALAFILSS
jgi:hypothetical protein